MAFFGFKIQEEAMGCFSQKDDDNKTFHPMKPRGCTDLFCLAVFFVFFAVFILLGAFAFVIGNAKRLVHGYDSFGNICGMVNEPLGNLSFAGMDMTNKPFVFYLNTGNVRASLKICIEKCPNEYIDSEAKLTSFFEKTGISLCRYDVKSGVEGSNLYPQSANKSLAKLFQKQDESTGFGPCPRLPIFPSKPVLNRCIPDNVKGLAKDVVGSIYGYLNSFDVIEQTVSDLYASRKEIVIMIAASIVFSIIMVFLIHFLARIVSWIIMTLVCLASLGVTGVLWWTYADIKLGLDLTPFEQLLEESAKNERAFLTYAIISTIITIIIICLVIVLRKRVHLVVALFKESGKCIGKMPCLLFQPVWTFIFLLLFFILWLAMLLALATAQYPVKADQALPLPQSLNVKAPDEELKTKNVLSVSEARVFTIVSYSNGTAWVKHMWWFHLVALVWVSEFILGCQQMVIAGAVASWYFCRDRSQLSCPILKSTWRMVLYHLGSVALGSFLITLFKVPRIILLYLESKFEQYKENPIASCCLKCCHCCLFCLEKFLKYLNHNAYTVIAIESVSFCTAARIAFVTLVSNALRVATINSVGDFILFLGKLTVTALTAILGILLMKHNEDLHFSAVPVFAGCVFAFFVAHCILSVYEMVIDTLFLCFCEDFNKNDGTPGKEYYAPKSLMKFMMEDAKDGGGPESTPLRSIRLTDAKAEPTPDDDDEVLVIKDERQTQQAEKAEEEPVEEEESKEKGDI